VPCRPDQDLQAPGAHYVGVDIRYTL
jgi:hypothetical protein